MIQAIRYAAIRYAICLLLHRHEHLMGWEDIWDYRHGYLYCPNCGWRSNGSCLP